MFDVTDFIYENHEVLWYTDQFLCYLPLEMELYNIELKELSGFRTLDIRYLLATYDENNVPYYDDTIKINPKYYNYVIDILNNNFSLIINDKNKILKIKEKIKEVILLSIGTSKNDIKKFLEELTTTEQEVLKFIIRDYNCADFYISVNKETQKTNISTSVYRTLFYKLKEFQIASVESAGVKGTHIIFNNFEKLKNLL